LRAKLISEYGSLAAYPYCGHGVVMGRRKIVWQNADYVLGLFGDKEAGARRSYSQFVRNGIEQGRRPDLIGGGLLRSNGGWEGIKALKESREYQKGDERILGDGTFVKEVLAKAEEKFRDKYRLKAEGYNLDKLIDRVSEITLLTRKQILDTARDRKRTEARSILCFWATDKLGVTQTELARILRLTQSAISHAARRGRVLVEDNSYSIGN
jgi:putative transposase